MSELVEWPQDIGSSQARGWTSAVERLQQAEYPRATATPIPILGAALRAGAAPFHSLQVHHILFIVFHFTSHALELALLQGEASEDQDHRQPF